MTDCNVMLGKLNPEHFPAVFGPDADEPLDADAVRAKFDSAGRRDRQGDRRRAAEPRGNGGGLPAHRGREHGERDQEDLGRARLRRHEIHAQLFRRGGGAACVSRGRCAGDENGCSCIPSRACCPLTAWVWPISGRLRERRSTGGESARTGRDRGSTTWPRKRGPRWPGRASRRPSVIARAHLRYRGSHQALAVEFRIRGRDGRAVRGGA